MRNRDELTERELDVLRLIASGHEYRAVARALGISQKTVGTHMKSIFQKLYVLNKSQAVHVAHIQRIIVLDEIPRYEDVSTNT